MSICPSPSIWKIIQNISDTSAPLPCPCSSSPHSVTLKYELELWVLHLCLMVVGAELEWADIFIDDHTLKSWSLSRVRQLSFCFLDLSLRAQEQYLLATLDVSLKLSGTTVDHGIFAVVKALQKY